MKFIKVRSLQSKILFLFVFLLLVVQLVSFFTTYRANQQIEKLQLSNTLENAKDVFNTQFINRRYYLAAFADTAAKDYGLKSVLQEDTKSFLFALNNHRKRINSDIAIAIDSQGNTFAELIAITDKETKKKVSVGPGQGHPFPLSLSYIQSHQNDIIQLHGKLYQLGFAPIKSGGRDIAWVGFGYVINNQLAQEFAQLTDVNVGFVVNNVSTEVVANSLLTEQQMFTSTLARQLIEKTDERYISTNLMLGDIQGDQLVGIMFTSKVDLLKNINVDWQQLFLLVAVTLALSLFGALGIAKSVTRPITQLIGQVKSLTQGNYDSDVTVDGSKEIKVLADEFNHMTQAIISREETISFQAFHDTLTKLPNKNSLFQQLATSRKQDKPFALFQLTLLGADEINDTLGYKVGDEILIEVATRLTQNTLSAKPYYIGGVNFVMLADCDCVDTTAKKLISELMLNCHFGNITLHLQYAMGVADSTQNDSDDVTALLQKSSVALQQAINHKKVYEKYNPEFDSNALERLYLTNSLKAAIEENQLVLFYQPKLSLSTMCITHVEALVRWEHPEKGLIPPDSFISIAEKTGQMDALTRWVTKEAIKQYLLWQRKGMSLQVAINISAENLLDKAYSDYVIDLKKQNNIPNGVITLEVTEDAVVADPEKATELLNYLHQHGFKLSIDDYGTGYSSLAQLKQLPVQELKVDRSFVQELASDSSDQIIVKSTIELAHSLGLTVVAEGIEDETTLKWLADHQCELAQGFFISRPQPADKLDKWLETSPYQVKKLEKVGT